MFVFITDWPALNVYQGYLEDNSLFDVFIGKGIGYNERLVARYLGNDYYSVFGSYYSSFESYLLSLLMQTGVLGLMSFLVIYFKGLKSAYRKNMVLYCSVLIGVLINIAFTPSFNGLAMSFIIWPLILFPIYTNKKTSLNTQGFVNSSKGVNYASDRRTEFE